MLTINSLKAGVSQQEILRDLTFAARPGEIHALMGPNGSGKSTLAHTIAGHPSFEVYSGTAHFENSDILALSPEQRAVLGIFLAFQHPMSIPGVSVSHFLRLSLNSVEKARGEKATSVAVFIKLLREKMKLLHMPLSFAERSVNDGFSGGEKKRLEMLQMLILRPKLVILDEIDSGLDIDAMKVVAEAVKYLHQEQPETIFLIITHYQRLLTHILPDYVHVMRNGKIIKSGGAELALELEKYGYAHL